MKASSSQGVLVPRVSDSSPNSCRESWKGHFTILPTGLSQRCPSTHALLNSEPEVPTALPHLLLLHHKKSDIPRGPRAASLGHPAGYTSSPLSLREIEWILMVGTLQFSWTRLPEVPAQQHSCRNPLLLALAAVQSLETVLAGTPCTAEKIFHSQTPSDLEIL